LAESVVARWDDRGGCEAFVDGRAGSADLEVPALLDSWACRVKVHGRQDTSCLAPLGQGNIGLGGGLSVGSRGYY
jgi:hypothetical protein